MMKQKLMIDHVMVDLETVDSTPTAGIISIGAVVFKGPSSGLHFYTAVDVASSLSIGLTQSDDTMKWWAQQNPKARSVFDDPERLEIHIALCSFRQFLEPLNEVRVWGNGAAFDNAILATAYRLAGLAHPWKFWNDRCYRTVVAGLPKRKQQGTFHNALDDAISQADHLMECAPELIK